MNKKSIRKGVSRLLAIGLVLAYMCMATACTNNDKNGNNSGSMAGNGATTENGTANGNGTDGTTNNNNTATTTPASETTTPAETMDNTNNMNGTDNGGEKRPKKEIGISAVRGGTIVGDHDVIFAGTDEVVTFSHTAYSKAVFGKGAIQAAKFLNGKDAGLYDMSQVIG